MAIKKFLTIDNNGYHKLVSETDEVVDYALNTSFEEGQLVIDTTNDKLYRTTKAFTSDATDIQNDITVNNLKILGGASASVTYTNATPVPADFGGIKIGKTFTNEDISTVLNELLYPYIAPTISLSSSVASGVKEYGTSIPSVVLSATTTKKSNNITDVQFLRNGTVINDITSPTITGAVETYTDSTIINDTVTYTAKVTDGTQTITSNSIQYTYVYPYFIGSLTTTTPTESDILGLTKLVKVKSDTNYSFTLTNSRFAIAFPQSYGTILSKITDQNLFDVTSDFTMSTVNVTINSVSVPYSVFIFNNITTQTNFSMTFKH